MSVGGGGSGTLNFQRPLNSRRKFYVLIGVFYILFRGQDRGGMTSTWGGRTPFGSQTPMVGSMTPSYGSMTPLHSSGSGGRTPMYGSQTPLHGDGERGERGGEGASI